LKRASGRKKSGDYLRKIVNQVSFGLIVGISLIYFAAGGTALQAEAFVHLYRVDRLSRSLIVETIEKQTFGLAGHIKISHIDWFDQSGSYRGTLFLNGCPLELRGNVELLCKEVQERCIKVSFFTMPISK
jgi:hypothetical protein